MLATVCKDATHPHFLCDHPGTHVWCPISLVRSAQSLISTSTPAARSSFINASTVCGVGSTISSRRLCVRISNCSRLFLSMCGERLTVNFSILVGNGMGPRTCAPVRLAVATISRVELSRMRWSNAFNRMRIFWPFMGSLQGEGARMTAPLCATSFDDARDHAGADGAAALADGEAKLLLHRDRNDQLDRHRDVVAGHHHLLRRADPHDLDFLAHLDHAALDAPRAHRAAARDRKDVLGRHQERLVLRTLGLRDARVHRLHELE